MVSSVVKLTRASRGLSQGAVVLALLSFAPLCNAQIPTVLGVLFGMGTKNISVPARPETVNFPAVRILDENSQPIPGAQVMIKRHGARSHGKLEWDTSNHDGLTTPAITKFDEPDEGTYMLLARAPGFAPKSTLVSLPASQPTIDVMLTRGQPVTLNLTDESGREIPPNLAMSLFPENWAVSVWLTAKSERVQKADVPGNNYPVSRTTSESLLSLFPVDRDSSSRSRATYTVQLDDTSTEPIYLLIDHPGFLRAYQAGPFLASDWITSKSIELTLPRPASLTGIFDLDGHNPESPIVSMHLSYLHNMPREGRWQLNLHTEVQPTSKAVLALNDLTPGEYTVTASMGPPEMRWHAETYSTKQSATLAAGSSETLTLKYAPFQEEWLKGPYTAKIKVLNLEGKPAAGANYKLIWSARNYPTQTIAQGTVPEDGIVVIENLAGIDKPLNREEIQKLPAFPDYTFQVNDSRIGNIAFFQYRNGTYVPLTEHVQEEEFRIPPDVGDPAPDFSMHDIASSKTIHLSDLKGQVILIDFWATWCGPCQDPMEKNQEILRRRKEDWKGKATILTVSIDDELETVIKHIDKNQWHESHNTWSPPNPEDENEVGWHSPAAKLYGINLIPTMILIDENGIIKKRGHMQVEQAILSELGH